MNFIHLNSLLFLVFFWQSIGCGAQPISDQPGHYVVRVGAAWVIALSDGTVPIGATALFHGNESNTVQRLLGRAYLNNPVEISINTFLIQTGDRLILVDAGSGELLGPAHGGKLITSMKTAGFDPNDITDVLITHIHNDHSGGLSRQGKPLFPNATVHINQKEIDYWRDHAVERIEESRGISANRPAFLALKPYLDAGKVKTFTGDREVVAGIETMEITGHTPGHTVFILESKGEKMVFWGDLIHIAAVQLHQPSIANEFDTDQKRAAMQRIKAYNEAAQKGYLIAADHISFPGIGRIGKQGNTFIWIPIPYSLSGRTR